MNWTDDFRVDANMTEADLKELLRPVSYREACEIFETESLLSPEETCEALTEEKRYAAAEALLGATKGGVTKVQMLAAVRLAEVLRYDYRIVSKLARVRVLVDVEELEPGYARIHVGYSDDGAVSNVWVEGIPVEWTDVDVKNWVRSCANDGDVVAKKALPFVGAAINYGASIRDGIRVYVD